MLYFFNPHKRHKLEKIILDDIQARLSLDFTPHNDCFKFIHYDPQLNIYGGVFLHEKKLSDVLPMPLLKRNDPGIWLATDLFYEIENNRINECVQDFDWHCQHFFRMLYEQFTNFAVTYGAEEIFAYLEENDHEDTQLFGKWLIDWSANFGNGMILSHLSFSRDIYAAFAKQWDTVDHKP